MSEEIRTTDQIATPRTDAAVAPARVLLGYDVVRADFARAQERTIAVLMAALRRIEMQVGGLRKNHKAELMAGIARAAIQKATQS